MTTQQTFTIKNFPIVNEDQFGGNFLSNKKYTIKNVDFPLIYVNADFNFYDENETVQAHNHCLDAIRFFSQHMSGPFVIFNYAYRQYILVADGHYKILNHFGGAFEYPTTPI